MSRLQDVGRFRVKDPTVVAMQVNANLYRVSWGFIPNVAAFLTTAEFEQHFEPVTDDEPMVQTEAGITIPDRESNAVIRFPFTPPSTTRPNANNGHNRVAGILYGKAKSQLRKDAGLVVNNLRNTYAEYPTYASDAILTVDVKWEKVRSAGYPNGRYRSFVDAHDALPLMCKGIIDGIVDAGLLEDDRHIKAIYRQDKDPDGAGYVLINLWGRMVESKESKVQA